MNSVGFDIICTNGPSILNYDVFKQMIAEGMTAIRINLSKSSIDEIEQLVENCKMLEHTEGKTIDIIFDTKGPELRVKTLDHFYLRKYQKVYFSNVVMTESKLMIELPDFKKYFATQKIIFINDGQIKLLVNNVTDNEIECIALNEGIIKNDQGLNHENIHALLPYLSSSDKQDILMALKYPVDYFALSFVNSKENIYEVRKFIESNSNKKIKLISKIETIDGLKNLDEIIINSDAVMVARGDLITCIEPGQLLEIQQKIIDVANKYGKPVIVATGLLHSMKTNIEPDANELEDLINAISGGANGIMFTSETAVGKYPVEVVNYASEIIDFVKKKTHH